MGKIILRLDRVMISAKVVCGAHRDIVVDNDVTVTAEYPNGATGVFITSTHETGKISAIRFSTLEAICEVLQCQPGDILEYDPNAVSEAETEE